MNESVGEPPAPSKSGKPITNTTLGDRNKKKNKDRKNCSWVEHEVEIHPGSYAHPDQQALLGIRLEEEEKDIGDTSKRKICMLLGYLGDGYCGFQINPGVKTLQAEVELALYQIGAMDCRNFGKPSKYSWSTSGRTDKGVHAAAQVVSLKAEFPKNDLEEDNTAATSVMDDFRNRLNKALPVDIRVLDVNRATSRFHAKTSRSYVRYRYMVPSFCLMESMSVHYEDVVDQLDNITPLLKDFRVSPDLLTKFRETLAKYEGTKSYHNFTRGKNHKDPSAKRIIRSFQAEDPVIHARSGTEWIPTTVVGQSFLTYQIRKMVAYAMQTTVKNNNDFDQAFLSESMPISTAPAQGLFLDMSFYDTYNERKEKTKSLMPNLDWTNEESESFRRWKDMKDRIVEHIMDEEHKNGNFVKFSYD